MQKFLQMFCNFFYYNKKIDKYKLIEVFFIIFHDFFPFFRNSSSSIAAGLSKCSLIGANNTDIEITCFNSSKSIRTRSNGYNIFTIYLINNSVCISSTFLLMKTKQWQICSLFSFIFNRTKYKIMLTWLVMYKC